MKLADEHGKHDPDMANAAGRTSAESTLRSLREELERRIALYTVEIEKKMLRRESSSAWWLASLSHAADRAQRSECESLLKLLNGV